MNESSEAPSKHWQWKSELPKWILPSNEKEADEDLSRRDIETMVEENNKTIYVKTYQ